MTPIFIYDLLIGGINVSDVHIVVFFNDYYTLIVAFLTKQIQNRYRYRRVATPRFSLLPMGLMPVLTKANAKEMLRFACVMDS